MKDKAHHLRHIQRKVIRANRQGTISTTPAIGVNSAIPELPVPNAMRLSEPKRLRTTQTPKLIKSQSYH